MSNFKIIISNEKFFISNYPFYVDTMFHIEYNGQFFPDKYWTDLTSSVLSMWTFNLVENSHKRKAKFELYFMDGPYRLDIIKKQDSVQMNCVDSHIDDDNIVLTINCSYDILLKEVCNALKSLDHNVFELYEWGKIENKNFNGLSKDCNFLISKLDYAINDLDYQP
jgi:hypothetical protein